MQWFRFYAEALNDSKVQTLPPYEFKLWVNALCYACSIDSKTGNIGTLDDVSFAFRETKSSVSSAFHVLIERGLIETVGETFQIKHWSKRQYKSDTSTERVKQYRKRSRNVTVTAPDTEKEQIQIQSQTQIKTPNPLYEANFELFWKEYPKTACSKKEAYKSYVTAIKKGSQHDGLISSVRAYRQFCERTGTPYAHPTTWLNQERWDVDYSTATAGKPTGFTPRGKGELADEYIKAGLAEYLAGSPF